MLMVIMSINIHIHITVSQIRKKSSKYLIRRNVSMSNKIIKKAAACGLSAVMAFGLVAVTEAPKQLMLVQQQKR